MNLYLVSPLSIVVCPNLHGILSGKNDCSHSSMATRYACPNRPNKLNKKKTLKLRTLHITSRADFSVSSLFPYVSSAQATTWSTTAPSRQRRLPAAADAALCRRHDHGGAAVLGTDAVRATTPQLLPSSPSHPYSVAVAPHAVAGPSEVRRATGAEAEAFPALPAAFPAAIPEGPSLRPAAREKKIRPVNKRPGSLPAAT